ncbi:capsular biosynthesis protein [Duncaniella freteri]|uniref:Capsular biosynthesis protein n=1 Tax=Duncaniella freteri TaxID=2530391 RepID=A0A4Z0V4M5_9BACT|nr:MULTISPECIES: capsular polysaccharide synthesis protein [Bacteroidales]TGG39297.1 capsular biosynthesis protein [Duncaniella freteri]
MNWTKYLKNAGGINLIKQYLRTGTLFTAINQFVVLGRDRKALELLRLGVEHKLYYRLRKKYYKRATDFKKTIDGVCRKSDSSPVKKIWICWWQGIDNAPSLVRKCYDSFKSHLPNWEIIVITKENYSLYVAFPDYITQKWESGIISNTHMSDLLRTELIIRHGGMWVDSTILCTSNNIPISIINSNLFFYQSLKPGADGHTVLCSTWLIYGKPGSQILLLTRELLYNYWRTKNKIDDYFIFHYFLTMACKFYPDEYAKIPQFDNATPHILLLNLFKKFDKNYWSDLCRTTCFHKLSYKLDSELVKNSQDTYYNFIMSDKNNEIP